jgi:hypothetical protein
MTHIKKKYLFVIRAYNDIDHFLPLIDYLLKNNSAELHIYSSVHPNLLLPNENLDYLDFKYSIKPKYLLENSGTNFLHRFEVFSLFLIKLFSHFIFNEFFEKAYTKVKQALLLFIKNRYEYYGSGWSDDLWKEVLPDIVIYDYTSPDWFPYRPITILAKKNLVPVVAIPHGFTIYTSLNQGGINKTEIDKGLGLIGSPLDFDYRIVPGYPGSWHLEQKGIPSDQIIELGAMRFDKDWISLLKSDVYQNMRRIDSCKKGDTKVVIFGSNLFYKGNPEKIKKMIAIVSKHTNCIIFKPHTRVMKMGFIKKIIGNCNIEVSYEPSVVLSEWCDLAVFWGSSIGIHILAENKAVLYPKFVHRNTTIYEKYIPDCIAHDLHDFDRKMREFVKNNKKCYTVEQVKNLMNDTVYNNENMNVSQKYANFLEDIVGIKKVT